MQNKRKIILLKNNVGKLMGKINRFDFVKALSLKFLQTIM
jgi:hypothetical protein